METDSKKAPPASHGNPAYPKLADREGLVAAAGKEKSDVRKIPGDDLKKAKRDASHPPGGKSREKK